MQHDIPQLLEIAKQVARRGAAVHRDRLHTSVSFQAKSSALDLVSEVDLETERVLTAEITKLRPEDGIVSEEGTSRPSSSGVDWIIDPLDGTINYLYGYPAHAVAVGVEAEGEGIVGVVYDTASNQLYAGAAGLGATCDGRPLQVSSCSSIDMALLATGFLPDRTVRPRQAAVFAEILPHVRDIRRTGSPALDLCRVAAGQTDGMYEYGLGRWDIVAGAVIAQAAGARVSILPSGNLPKPLLIVSTSDIYDALKELVVQASEHMDECCVDGRNG